MKYNARDFKAENVEDHPLWQRQVALEISIGERISRLQEKRLDEAKEDGNFHSTNAGRTLVNSWYGLMVEAIVKAINNPKRGPVEAFIPLMARCHDLQELCKASLQHCLVSCAAPNGVPLMPLAKQLGCIAMEMERMHIFEKLNPKLYRWLDRKLKDSESTVSHSKIVMKAAFNRNFNEDSPFTPWTVEEQVRVGMKLVDVLCTVSGRFTLQESNTRQETIGVTKPMKNPLCLIADPALVTWITSAIRSDKSFITPALLPTLICPRKVEHGCNHIGYWTDAVPTPILVVRRNADKVIAKGSKVYDAINALNSTAWKINSKVLEVAQWAWDMDNGIGGLPLNRYQDIPTAPKGMDAQQLKVWKAKAKPIYTANAQRVRKTRRSVATLKIAKDYKDEQQFYFPHNLDSRGRAYPVVANLSPQGNDLARGLLTFAEGKPIGERGLWWLKVHVANQWGMGKLTFEERVQGIDKKLDVLSACAENPRRHRDWAEQSNPWQALAGAIELHQAISSGPSYRTTLPVVVDGSCNGLQHLSALSLDEDTARLVNVLPSDKPQDIYRFVAEKITEELLLRKIHTTGKDHLFAKTFLKMVEGEDEMLPREFAKQPVMVFPYGGKLRGYQDLIWKYCTKNHKGLLPDDFRQQREMCGWLAKIVMQTITEIVNLPSKAQAFIEGCVRAIANSGKHAEWTLPTGFTCTNRYVKYKRKRIEMVMAGRRYQIIMSSGEAEIHVLRAVSASPPNFVHSLDAAALCLAICLLVESAGSEDLVSFMAIHDGYGTYAPDMDKLAYHLREAFVTLHCDHDMLKQLHENAEKAVSAFAMSNKDVCKLPVIPAFIARGSLDVKKVRDSLYFFA